MLKEEKGEGRGGRGGGGEAASRLELGWATSQGLSPHPAVHSAAFLRTMAVSLCDCRVATHDQCYNLFVHICRKERDSAKFLLKTENTCPANFSLYLIGQNCATRLFLNL